MKQLLSATLFFLCLAAVSSGLVHAQTVQVVEEREPIDFVNILMGSQSEFLLSNGNVYPAIARPWGMNFWTPQTGEMGSGWQYVYGTNRIRGFKQTHMPSPWMNDYGQFSLMPTTGLLKLDEDDRRSWYTPKTMTAKPNYFGVYLGDYDVTVEITPTERAAMFRFTFPESDRSHVIVDAFDRGSYVKIIPEENKVIGYTTRNSGGVPDNFRNYFVVVFDTPFDKQLVWDRYDPVDAVMEVRSPHSGAALSFKTHRGQQITARVASSFISHEQAELNLRELAGHTFESLRAEGRDIWNKELSRIAVNGGTVAQTETFYSTLWRTLLFPRKFYEFDANGDMYHYSPYDGGIHSGYMMTDNGFWDTFRAVFPFFNLMHPSFNEKKQAALANVVRQSKFLPEWASPGHRSVMIGNNSSIIVADAWLRGLRGYDIDTLYEGILYGSENVHPEVSATGRLGHEYYNTLGYVPYDVGVNESAARTLEYAFADWAIWKLAKELGRPDEEIQRFYERSQNWKHLFDPEHNLMRGKNRDGTFQSPFNPFKWGDAFTEGNSWHYTWSVFHDVHGLKQKMGGREMFVTMLDSVFIMPPVHDHSYYGFQIHEITEMRIADQGQYAHGNQPIQHMIYLYNYAGEPWKAQYWAREVMDKLYHPTPDGYPGDEDNGQTSAWYVFSAMGFYPVAPGTGQYVLGSPLFPEMHVELENGNRIEIIAHNQSPQNRYIQAMRVNGEEYSKNYLEHDLLMQGAKLEFWMGPRPNKQRGTSIDDFPYSMSLHE